MHVGVHRMARLAMDRMYRETGRNGVAIKRGNHSRYLYIHRMKYRAMRRMRGEDRYGPALPHPVSLFIVSHYGIGWD